MSEPVKFFKTPGDFRKWLENNHLTAKEQWVGFYKKGTKLPGITWPESVDQALCFGWIDGLRRSIDHQSYKIRFTPRKHNSHWSAINISRIKELSNIGLVAPAGLDVFAKRNPDRSKQGVHEQTQKIELDKEYQKQLEDCGEAWSDFKLRRPSYQKQCIWWILSAKKEETRKKRLKILIDSCKQGQKIPPLRWQK